MALLSGITKTKKYASRVHRMHRFTQITSMGTLYPTQYFASSSYVFVSYRVLRVALREAKLGRLCVHAVTQK